MLQSQHKLRYVLTLLVLITTQASASNAWDFTPRFHALQCLALLLEPPTARAIADKFLVDSVFQECSLIVEAEAA